MADGLDGPVDLPYRAEYAKTARASCKTCKSTMDKGDLKMGLLVTSRFHDGKDALFSHFDCFFSKHRPKSVGDIEHFATLRWDDQERIKKKIGAAGPAAGGSKSAKAQKSILTNFSIAYAKSGASTCIACEEKIPKAAIRISTKDYESEKAIMFGNGQGMDRWHHLDCFVKVRGELEFFENGKQLPGFKNLERVDQAEVTKKLPAIKPASEKSAKVASGKRKLDEKSAEATATGPAKKSKKEEKSIETQIKKHNKQMFDYNDALEDCTRNQLITILSKNKQEIPDTISHDEVVKMISDMMVFGALKRCPKCKGQFYFRSGIGYQCSGYITEYTRCMHVTEDPERVPFQVPNDMREMEPFKSYKFKAQKRIIQHFAPTVTAKKDKPKPKLIKNPLKDFTFFIATSKKPNIMKWTKKIEEFGGTVTTNQPKKSTKLSVAAVITTDDDMKKKSADITWAEKKGIPVVKGEFVDSVKELNYNLTEEITKYLICDWVRDVAAWLKSINGDYEERILEKRVEKGKFEKKLTSVKLKMKDGAVVDPESDLEDIGHVLKDGKLFFNCVLNRASIEDGLNSYYKMQIIESDFDKRYWIFKSWGRIGTTVGSHSVDEVSKDEAIELFHDKYVEKTGNRWGPTFKKRPGMYTRLEIDYGEREHVGKMVPSKETSQLPMAVQELVSLIFDVDRMKQAMMEFELNLDEMPLGKISRKQVLSAYSTLNDATSYIQKISKGDKDSQHLKRLILDVSNKFYTMIPHNFGSRAAPMLDNDEIVKKKLEMLESLLEIELAYEMLLEGDKGGESSIDAHYKTLQAAVDPVESGSEEFIMLEKYMKNTHAATHSSYALEIQDVFKVNRNGENQRYLPYKDFHNRKLLWHGSRVTNFAGILSQGLRIAPAEAPVTGYMFGKGVYFADMVSKSANYCNAGRHNSTGILLICEVALGDMHELKSCNENLTKAPKKYHSVKGLGQTEPDPTESITLPDGVVVPLGKPVRSQVKNSSLLYNEYIVYDTAQINIRYLLKVNFKY